MEEMFISIAGMNHYYGNEFLEPGMELKLIKDVDNEYDKDAIRIELKGLGKIGFVANSTHTVIGECMSAGRLYDKIGDIATAKMLYKFRNSAICEVIVDKNNKKPSKRGRRNND